MTQIHRADPRSRRWAVILVVLGTAAGVLLISLAESQRPALEAWITSDPVQVNARLRLAAIGVGVVFGVPTLLFAIYFWRLGARILRSGQCPPPGMRIIRDTMILYGQTARWRGRVLQTLAVILALGVVGFAMILWLLMSLLASRATSAGGGP